MIGQPALTDSLKTALLRIDTANGDTVVLESVSMVKQVFAPAQWPGFALTVVAILFGAPFWWEALRRLMGMRTRRPSAQPT